MKKIILTLTVLLSLSVHAGDRIGNGNGDGAFALQELARQNPNLSPKEVLLKAFNESVGRVPDFKNGTLVLNMFRIFENVSTASTINIEVLGINTGPLLPATEMLKQVGAEDGYFHTEKTPQSYMILRQTEAVSELREYAPGIYIGVSRMRQTNFGYGDRFVCEWFLSSEYDLVHNNNLKLGDICAVFYMWNQNK